MSGWAYHMGLARARAIADARVEPDEDRDPDSQEPSTEATRIGDVYGQQHWCSACPEPGVPHRVTFAGQLCPSCADDAARGGAA